MKQYIMALCVLLAFSGCEEFTNSAEKSKITFLPAIEVLGESQILLTCDAAGYEDAGAVATEGGAEIPVITTINARYFGSAAVNGPDAYDINYSAANKDGIPALGVRKVTWPECNGDLVTSIAGMYSATVVRNGATAPQYANIGPIYIVDLGGGIYGLSDAIGGWYEYGRSLGAGYTSTGMTITANNIPANNFTFGDPVEQGGFGGIVEMESFTVTPAQKKIVFQSYWDFDYTFVVTLIQNP